MLGRVLMLVGLAVALALSTPSAMADPLQIVCPATCSFNGTVNTTTDASGSFSVTLNNSKYDGELWIAVIEPVTSGANFSGSPSTTMWSVFGLSGGSDHNLASTESAEGAFFTGSDVGFEVTLVDTGMAFTGSGQQTLSVTVPGGPFPPGTIFVAFTGTFNGTSGTVFANTPWSESLEVTGVPEPGSLALMGAGLLSMAGILRRRFFNS